MDVLSSAILSGVVALITSIITLKVTQRNEVRRHILEQRTKLYLDAFAVIDELCSNPWNVFNRSYMDRFIGFKASMKLLASRKAFRKYAELFNLILKPSNFYDIYVGHVNKEKKDSFDQETLAAMDQEDLDLSPDEFRKKYVPNPKLLSAATQALYEAMREDLGSNIK